MLAVALLLLVFAPAAGADLVVGSPGSGAGQYKNPGGVAVDASTGRVYVADTENDRIDVFDETGAFLFAFGWRVNATTPEEKLQVCTSASGCETGTSGPGAGQLNRPEGIAVDSSSHEVYVAEDRNHRVQKFDSSGAFLLTFGKGVNTGTSGKPDLCTNAGPPTDICGQGSEGSGPGQFNSIAGIGVGPASVVYVADTLDLGPCLSLGAGAAEFSRSVQTFTSSGEVTKRVEPAEAPCGALGAFAVDFTGDSYLANGNSHIGGVHKYDESGTAVTSWGNNGIVDATSPNIGAIAPDPTGDLFVADFSLVRTAILRYGPTGAQTLVFFGDGALKETPLALAFHHDAGGDLFAIEKASAGSPSRVVQLALPEPGPLLVPGSAKPSVLGSVRSTLKVEFNSEGKPSKARFQYIAKSAYETNVTEAKEGFTGSTQTPFSAETPADFENHTVEATNVCVVPTEASCLKPETTYYFRAIASNADGEVKGERAEFTTKAPHEIGATWVSDVATDSALLHAEVNPLGIATTGRFEYVDDASFQSEGGFAAPDTQLSAPVGFGAAETSTTGAVQLASLVPGTTYHYRLRAEDPFFPAVISAEDTFTTFAPSSPGEESCTNAVFRIGQSAVLPDCRAFELVSPVDKNNGDIITRINVFGFPTNLDQSSTAGSGFTYSSYRAFAEPKGAPYTSQYLARRDPKSGWASESIDPPRGQGFRFELENSYKAFSADLESGWLLQESEPTLSACAPGGFADLYRRSSAGGGYQALSCAEPQAVSSLRFLPEIEGFAADGSESVFRADAALTPDGSGASTGGRPIYQVYETSAAGQTALVSVLPNGEASGADASAGTAQETNVEKPWNFNRKGSLQDAVSSDGERVFWSTGIGGSGPIYLRENATGEQSLDGSCDEAGKACTIAISGGEPAFFQAANSAGTKVLFTITAGPNAGNLYEYDVGSQEAKLIGEDVLANILGASSDLARIYFASEEANTEEQAEGAEAGKPNVYLAEGGSTRFVATLSSGGVETSDVNNPYGTPIATTPIFRTARASAGGGELVFMSNSRQLSEKSAGYDNTDASSPVPCGSKNEAGEEGICDAEVYLYDAEAGAGKGKLRCVSCNPSGARPSGREIEIGANGKVGPFAAGAIPLFETQLYQPRYLSDDGKRVFFDSFDALTPGDSNGKEDVYQWEAVGMGGCKEKSPSFVKSSEGCLTLISSGSSPGDSEFLDASPSGADVFFTTVESLLSQDPGLVDVYDARVDGGFPPETASSLSCEGEACQSPPSPPLDLTPGSLTFSGAGNLAPFPTILAPKPAAKVLTRAQRLAKALRACRNKPRPKRKGCETAARKRYGARTAGNAKRSNKKGKRS
jgi:hypothetical protein